MNIQEGNKLIAEFMGVLLDPLSNTKTSIHFGSKPLQYHSSWDWLKPVVDEIFKYSLAHPDEVRKIRDISIVVGIGACWEKVVQFIQWLNSTKAGNP